MTRKSGAWTARLMLASACVAASMHFVSPVRAAGEMEAIPEQQLKAAYILNFARYAVWPAPALADPRAPLVLCTYGAGVADIARQLQSRLAGSHPLELRNIARVEEAEGCHALYIGAVERTRQSTWLAKLRDLAVLTIGDSSTFLADGGMINLLPVDGGIRFEVNLGAARHSGMSLHPRMLALAERVVGGAGGGVK